MDRIRWKQEGKQCECGEMVVKIKGKKRTYKATLYHEEYLFVLSKNNIIVEHICQMKMRG